MGAAAKETITVQREIANTINLLENRGDFLKDPKISRTIFLYMLRGRRKNQTVQRPKSMKRDEMLEHIASLG